MVARQEPNANGVTYGAHGQGRDKECYAEFEMTHVNKDSSKWQACLFEGKSYPICNIYIRSDLLLDHSIFLIIFNELDVLKVSPKNVTQKSCGHLRRVGWKRRVQGGTDIQKWKLLWEFQ